MSNKKIATGNVSFDHLCRPLPVKTGVLTWDHDDDDSEFYEAHGFCGVLFDYRVSRVCDDPFGFFTYSLEGWDGDAQVISVEGLPSFKAGMHIAESHICELIRDAKELTI